MANNPKPMLSCRAALDTVEPNLPGRRPQDDLIDLEARANTLEAELADVRAQIERIKIYLELAQRYGAGDTTYASAQVQMPLNHPSDPISQKGPLTDNDALIQACRGKSIPDAAIALIRLAGRPLSEEEIVDQLRRGQVTIVSENPALNLRFALLRKRKETGAIKLADDKKRWTLGDNPMPETESPKPSGFIQNRDRNNHAEKSRQGLLAAKERGTKNGRKLTITPEQKELAERLLAQGMKFTEIAKQIGVGTTTLLRWRSTGLINTDRPIIPRRKYSVIRLVASKS